MNIGLIDVDGHNFPNLALMRISAYHKARGDTVEWWDGFKHYGRVYMSKVFTFTPDMDTCIDADEVVRGGTGYGLESKLPHEIEHICPDYSLYGITDTAYGFLTRGCPRACPFCIVADKEGRRSYKASDLSEWWRGQKYIELMDPNTLACPDHLALLEQLADSRAWVNINQGADARLLTEANIAVLNKIRLKMIHFAWDQVEQSESILRGLELYAKHGALDERKRRVYVLVNFNTSMEENLYRIYRLREMQFDPYVMVYDKPHSPKEIRRLQRWVNNKFIFRSCERFEDYAG